MHPQPHLFPWGSKVAGFTNFVFDLDCCDSMRRRIWAADDVGDTSSVFDPSMTEHQGTDIGGSGGNGILDSSTTLGGERKDKRQPIPRSVCNGHEKEGKK